ncbi:MAG: CDP-diacylglycerol--glycerol-3-phosphate 3-phosphatidyltransferase [Malacoplasma sp.]
MFAKFQKHQIPNLLTLSRLFFIPVILIFLFVDFGGEIYTFSWSSSITKINLNFLLAGVIFVILSSSDFLDGYLARKFNWVSNFGKIWDPVADKILINSVFISFSVMGLVPWYLTIMMFARDVIIDAYRMYAANYSIIVKANLFGKLKTVFQILSIIIIFFIFNSKNNALLIDHLLIQNLCVFIATFISIASGIYYIFSIKKKLNNKLDIIKKD